VLDHPDGCPAGSCREAEARDLLPADAHPQALAAWDAWDDVRRDEAADAARPELHPARAGAAEKSVGRERGVRERHAWRRQSGLQVAPGVELGALALYIQVAARSAERSYEALVAAESRALQ